MFAFPATRISIVVPLVTPPPGLKSCSSTFSNMELPAGWFPVAIVALLEDALYALSLPMTYKRSRPLGAVVRN